jgi:oxygen-independent coproporphyrinogen-3 oxidase
VRCSYCAFTVFTHRESKIPGYLSALTNELRWIGAATPTPLRTIYLGGGTPSLLTTPQISSLLDSIRQSFDLLPDPEISMEINPDTIPEGYFDAIRAAGVNRLSVGMQSANSQELTLFTRGHQTDDVARVMRSARLAGFDNISLDLIYGIPDQTLESWRHTLETALSLTPDHLSMYALQIEPKTALEHWVAHGTVPIPDDDLAADMYELADKINAQAGLVQYEISTWARPNKECLHNLQYWRNQPYLGVGTGAHGYIHGTRYVITKSLKQYITLAGSLTAPVAPHQTPSIAERESIDQRGGMVEHMITGLRLLREGVSLTGFAERFGVSLDSVFGDPIQRLMANGFLYIEDGALRLSQRARLLSNRVFVEFLEV